MALLEWINTTYVLIALALLTLILLYQNKAKATREMPPGIRGFGAFGFFLDVARRGLTPAMHDHSMKFGGEIASVSFLDFPMLIFLGTHRLMKESLKGKGDTFSARPMANKHTEGLMRSSGRLWKEQRSFTLRTLRDFGMGKIQLEGSIQDEANELIKAFHEQDEAFDFRYVLGYAASNVISSVVFSDRFSYNDPKIRIFLKCFSEDLANPQMPILLLFPLSRFLPGLRDVHEQLTSRRNSVVSMIKQYIEYHKQTFDENNIRDYLDAYLKVQNQKPELDSTFTDSQLVANAFDLFMAGSETTMTFLRWALALMAKHPEVQAKVQHEIDDHVHSQCLPSMADKLKLTYVEAVMLEIHRFATISPQASYAATQDTQIDSYLVRKGDWVMLDILLLHRDTTIWPYPDTFHVGNFLDDNGLIRNREYCVPFSIGKRACLGESLAQMEAFLFFTALMQKFTFSFPEGCDLDLSEPNLALVRSPPDYRILATART